MADTRNIRKACPHCSATSRRKAKDRSLSITITTERLMWHCFRCRWKGAHRWEYLFAQIHLREQLEGQLGVRLDR